MTALEAIAETRRVAQALAALPDCRGTCAEIAAASGLSPDLVFRRLRSAGWARMPGNRVFAVAEPPRGSAKAVWGLTPFGKEMVEGA